MSNKIENRLVFFNKESSFNDRLQRLEIQPQSLVFIKDKKKIWTQNQEFSFDPSDDPTIQQIRQDVDVNTTNINNLMGTAIHADEEDTTSVDGALKFADKQYDGASFSGYGRKYLRKNGEILNSNGCLLENALYGKSITKALVPQFSTDYIRADIVVNGEKNPDGYDLNLTKFKNGQHVGHVGWSGFFGEDLATSLPNFFNNTYLPFVEIDDYDVLLVYVEKRDGTLSESDEISFSISDKLNILTLDMLPYANTVYHIQYDYNLLGETITVPNNCTLQFDGGSLCNGIIFGNNSMLVGEIRTTSPDIEGIGRFTGTWKNFGNVTPTDNVYEGRPFLHEYYNKMLYFRTDNGGADRVWMDAMGYSPMIKAGNTRPEVPSQTSIDNTGYQFFDKQQNRPVWWNGFEWVDCSGRKAHKHIGTTAERPADLDSADYGYEYFDTTIGKNIYWIGDREWVDEEGFTAGIHKGTYDEALALRDSLTLDDVGYKYYATDLNKDIYLTNNYESNVFEFDGFADVAAQDIQPSSVNQYIDPAEIENDPTNFRVLFNNTTGKFICFYIDAYYSNWRYTNSDKYINPQNNYAYLYDDQYYTVTHGQVVDTLFETPVSNLLEWKDSYGFTPAMNKGTTEQGKFVLFGLDKTKDAGFEFFNTTLNRQFYAAMRDLSFRKPLSVKNIGGEDIYAYYFSKKEIDYIFSRTEGFTATLESSVEGDIKVISYDDANQQYEQIYGTNQYPFDSDTIVFDEGTMVDMIGESHTIGGPAYADLNYDYVAIIPDQSVIVPNQIVNPDFEVLQYVADPDSILDWVDKNGRLAGHIGGYDSLMPVGLNSTTDVGYEFFLIDLDKPFYWDGERWVDGNDVVYYQNEN